MAESSNRPTLDTLIAFCKRRGFIYQTADIYGGLNGVYDIGHLGVLFTENIKKSWLTALYAAHENIIRFDGAILGSEPMWKASGHLDGFHDPMVDCQECKHRFRADEFDLDKGCPHCGKKNWTDIRQFNMMFKTNVGASEENSSAGYLRPETAQSIFVQFKNIITTNRVKLPFGVAQIGKAFRNEITPKQFLFRVREFEQMELEWFCKKEDAPKWFEFWQEQRLAYYTKNLGLDPKFVRAREYPKEELAHYAQATTDIEYEFPFGWKELEGVADRGAFDLTQHSKHSGKEQAILDDETNQTLIPHVIESSVGVGRLFLTILFDAYKEEEIDGETRVVLKLKPKLAPVKAAFFPLSKKIAQPMLDIYKTIRAVGLEVNYDDSGSIGKRYRRQDEIGTPLCFTYDFDSEENGTVTVRFRDSMEQKRISVSEILPLINKTIEE